MKSYIFFIVFLLSSCVPDVEYKSVSNFDVQDGLINNGEKITLFYSSATPKDVEKATYFIHLIAEVASTGDSLNILTIFNRGAGKGDSKNEFVFYTLESEEGKSYFDNLKESYSFSNNIDDLSSIERVTYDKRFDFATKNNYPTVIGFIDKEKSKK